MPFIPGVGKVERVYCFSVSDFHEFDNCPFSFFVNHHLGKKYELAEGNQNMVVGNLLDGAIKKYHRVKGYNLPLDYLPNLIRAQYREIEEDIAGRDKPSFNTAMKPFLSQEALQKAIDIFVNYFQVREGRVNSSLGEVSFLQEPILFENGHYVVWGWPDAYELGEDGIPEVVDYKFREDVEKGKRNMDMDLMPKIYTFLAAKYLKSKGYKRARFVVRIWQDPLDSSLNEEFDLDGIESYGEFFKQKIDRILGTEEVRFCDKDWCKVCKHEKRADFLKELQDKGFLKMTGEEFLQAQNFDNPDLPF
jgi:hypothetical protein